jgi:hypothetical protein
MPEYQSCNRRQRDGVLAARSPPPLGRQNLQSVSALSPLVETLFLSDHWCRVRRVVSGNGHGAISSTSCRNDRFRNLRGRLPRSGEPPTAFYFPIASKREAGVIARNNYNVIAIEAFKHSHAQVHAGRFAPDERRGAAIWARMKINFVGREAKE